MGHSTSKTVRLTDADIDNIAARYIEGNSVRLLALAYGVGRREIRRVLLQSGIRVRNRHLKVRVDPEYMPDDPTPEEIAERARQVREDGFISRRRKVPPWSAAEYVRRLAVPLEHYTAPEIRMPRSNRRYKRLGTC